MGQDKALLPLPGNSGLTFLEHLCALLLDQCAEVLLVASDTAHAAAYCPLVPSTVQLVHDQLPGHGPLMGLYSGLSAMRATHALAVAVDMPYILPEMIAWMLAFPPGETLVVPRVQNRPQVLFALYPRSALPFFAACLSQGRRDPKAVLDIAPVTYIEESLLRSIDPPLRSFLNMNTPADLGT